MSLRSLDSSYSIVVSEVGRFGRFRKRWAVIAGLSKFVLAGPGLLLTWFLLDWIVLLPAWPLFVLFVAVGGVALGAVIAWVLWPMLRRVHLENEALLIESLHGKLDNQIIGALQLGREVSEALGTGKALGYSPHLVAALVAQTSESLRRLQPVKLLDLRRVRRLLACALAVVLAIAVTLLVARTAVQRRIERLQDAYAAVLDSLLPVEMRVSPGNVTVVRGRPVTLGVEVIGARRREVRLLRAPIQTADKASPAFSDAAVDCLSLREGRAALHIPRASESFRYRFEYARRASKEYSVLVGDLPTLSAINYELIYPAYTGQPPRTLTGRIPRLHALVGTDVLVSFAASTELHPELSYVEWQVGPRQAMNVTGRFGHFSFQINRPNRATIHLTGAHGPGFEMEQPVTFEVAVQRDEAPTVEVLLKQKKLTMLAEEAASLGLSWVAEDDFGVSEVTLDWKIEAIDELLGRQPRQGSAPPRRFDPALDRVRGIFPEIFKDTTPPLAPGDRITITLRATDNNTLTGPGVGRSQPVEIVVVRPDLAGFTERQFAFGSRALLGGLQKVKRATDLLIDPVKSIRTEAKHEIEKQEVKSRVAQESWPSGSEDAVGDYFLLMSGER